MSFRFHLSLQISILFTLYFFILYLGIHSDIHLVLFLHLNGPLDAESRLMLLLLHMSDTM